MILNPNLTTSSREIRTAVDLFGTPAFIYDERSIAASCRILVTSGGSEDLTVRYAMKANSGKAILQIADDQGLKIDASSLEEARRAVMAGISPESILLTSQSVPENRDIILLDRLMRQGLIYNICSLSQLSSVMPLVRGGKFPVYCRIHPGMGSGESQSRDTGSPYSSFGIQQQDIPLLLETAARNEVDIKGVHIHIGSGSDPEIWLKTAQLGIQLLRDCFPSATVLNLGGGFRTGRMPGEETADVRAMITAALDALFKFRSETGRRIHLEVEPGTFVMANAGFLVTQVMDIKSSADSKLRFILLNAGMEANPRPALYGSQHPFYIIDPVGDLKYSQFCGLADSELLFPTIVAGRCCETGDSQTIDARGRISPRMLPVPSRGDLFAVGGCGAYCSSMAPSGYNSNLQLRELLIRRDGSAICIRAGQSLRHLVANEVDLPERAVKRRFNDRYTG